MCSFKDLSKEIYDLDACTQELRDFLCSKISKAWPRDKILSQKLSDLLDKCNELLDFYKEARKNPGGPALFNVQPAEDDFWSMNKSVWQGLLEINVERGEGPATLPAETTRLGKRPRYMNLGPGLYP